MILKELLKEAKKQKEAYKQRGEKKTLEFCLLNLVFERYYYIDDSVKNALLQEMASIILNLRDNKEADFLEDNIKEWHKELLED